MSYYQDTRWGWGLTPLQRSSRCILQPQPTGQYFSHVTTITRIYLRVALYFAFMIRKCSELGSQICDSVILCPNHWAKPGRVEKENSEKSGANIGLKERAVGELSIRCLTSAVLRSPHLPLLAFPALIRRYEPSPRRQRQKTRQWPVAQRNTWAVACVISNLMLIVSRGGPAKGARSHVFLWFLASCHLPSSYG